MARIRTIKPEFWTDDALTECSLSARLLFIGTWNFADDNGNLERSSKQLKMKIFPADEVRIEPLIDELIHNNLLVEYQVGGKKYLHIRTFKSHQVVNRPSKTRLPKYEDSLNTHGTLTEPSLTEGKGREGKGIETSSSSSTTEEIETEASAIDLGQTKMMMKEFTTLFQQTFNKLMPGGLYHDAMTICKRYPPEKIRESFRLAVENNANSLRYVETVLEAKREPKGTSKPKPAEIEQGSRWKCAKTGDLFEAQVVYSAFVELIGVDFYEERSVRKTDLRNPELYVPAPG